MKKRGTNTWCVYKGMDKDKSVYPVDKTKDEGRHYEKHKEDCKTIPN